MMTTLMLAQYLDVCYQVGVEVPEFLGEGGSGGDAGGDDDEDWGEFDAAADAIFCVA